jgi:hypothetical protein
LQESVRAIQERLAGLEQLHEAVGAINQRLAGMEARLSLHVTPESGNEKSHLSGFEYPYVAKPRAWDNAPFVRRLTKQFEDCEDQYTRLLEQFLQYREHYATISVNPSERPGAPHWVNGWFPGLDAIALYYFLTTRNPPTLIEIGSGNSTAFARQAITDQRLRTRIVSIDPEPRKEIDAICDEVIRSPLEQVDVELFARLSPQDMVFVDSSHRCFQNSDVMVFFAEILGHLPTGVLYGLHDILLPRDYWGAFVRYFYNEQYLLLAYLAGGADGDKIVLPINYISHCDRLQSVLDPVWKDSRLTGIEPFGGTFWMERGGVRRS